MKGLYEEGIRKNKPFICEGVNHNLNLFKDKNVPMFSTDTFFFGAQKNNETIKELIEYLKNRNLSPHFTSELDFLGDTTLWCTNAVNKNKMNLIGGEKIGIKTTKGKPILIDDLMEEDFLDLDKNTYGIYIPQEEVLRRIKYQWFAVLNGEQLLNSRLIIAKYLKASIVDSTNEYTKSNDVKSVVAI